MSVRSGPRRDRRPGDYYGLGPPSSFLAPLLSIVGLVVVAALTVGLLGGELPVGGDPNRPGGNGGGNRTPAPSNVVIVDPRTEVPGSLVYAKGGNVWVQSGTSARQVTTSGTASMPSWSPDGEWIYYIDSIHDAGRFPQQGVVRRYDLTYPNLMRIRPDGTGEEVLTTGRFVRGDYTWFYWIREPVLSPDGHTLAVTSDGPDPQQSDVVIQLYDLATGAFTKPPIPEREPLGHQDPTWSPDGRFLAFVYNNREGAAGAPQIFSYDTTSGKVRQMTGPGYLSPTWSPDGRWLAATRTGGLGTDVVVLDGGGGEVFRATSDGSSWAPVWSPKGDALAFLHIANGIVDLRMVTLEGAAPAWTVGETLDLTEVSGLDSISAPDWFIPADQLPTPTPTPIPSQPDASAGTTGAP